MADMLRWVFQSTETFANNVQVAFWGDAGRFRYVSLYTQFTQYLVAARVSGLTPIYNSPSHVYLILLRERCGSTASG